MGRAARNVNGRVIMYAERITPAMQGAMDETLRRRAVQAKYNEAHGIVPATVVRSVLNVNPASGTVDYYNVPKTPKDGKAAKGAPEIDLGERLAALRLEMFTAAENLEFEKAARLRDELKRMEAVAGADGEGNGTVKNMDDLFNPYASKGTRARTAKKAAGASAKPGSRGSGSSSGRKWKR
jgi:excinuclease ABC subunit B